MWTNNGDIMFALGKLGVPALTSSTRGILDVKNFVNSMGGFTRTNGNKSSDVAFKSYTSNVNLGISKLNAPYFVDARAITAYYPWDSNIMSSGFTFGIGSGTTPASKNDFKLETPYTYNTDYQGSEGMCTVTNSDTQTIITQSIDIKAIKEMTISEVSLVTCYDSNMSSNSSSTSNYVMVFRELLSTPLTLQATETGTFNFTFVIEHATGLVTATLLGEEEQMDVQDLSEQISMQNLDEDIMLKGNVENDLDKTSIDSSEKKDEEQKIDVSEEEPKNESVIEEKN